MNQKLQKLISDAKIIVVVQADNPDADSLGSALALEQILGEMGKSVWLYCGVDMPSYLHYLSGWDRVVKDLPQDFDASIVVDASTLTLLEQLDKTGQLPWLKSKPCAVLDHHSIVERPLEFADIQIIDTDVASAGELIFSLAKQLAWPLDATIGEYIMASILGDTQGLTNDLAKASTYRVMSELIELGVDRSILEEKRRLESKMPEKIYRYKAELIKRTELLDGNQIATVTIPQDEINEYSPHYNPAVLVQFETLMIEDVRISIIFKTYSNGRMTAKIRCNSNTPIAGELAESFGGGGHKYSGGFRIERTDNFEEIKSKCLDLAAKLLDTHNQETSNE